MVEDADVAPALLDGAACRCERRESRPVHCGCANRLYPSLRVPYIDPRVPLRLVTSTGRVSGDSALVPRHVRSSQALSSQQCQR